MLCFFDPRFHTHKKIPPKFGVQNTTMTCDHDKQPWQVFWWYPDIRYSSWNSSLFPRDTDFHWAFQPLWGWSRGGTKTRHVGGSDSWIWFLRQIKWTYILYYILYFSWPTSSWNVGSCLKDSPTKLLNYTKGWRHLTVKMCLANLAKLWLFQTLLHGLSWLVTYHFRTLPPSPWFKTTKPVSLSRPEPGMLVDMVIFPLILDRILGRPSRNTPPLCAYEQNQKHHGKNKPWAKAGGYSPLYITSYHFRSSYQIYPNLGVSHLPNNIFSALIWTSARLWRGANTEIGQQGMTIWAHLKAPNICQLSKKQSANGSIMRDPLLNTVVVSVDFV